MNSIDGGPRSGGPVLAAAEAILSMPAEGVPPGAFPGEALSADEPAKSGAGGFLDDLKAGWESMGPRSRWVFVGSAAVSAAAFGYITVECGPIPSLRKIITGLPDHIGPENRAWLRYSAGNAVAAAKRIVRPSIQTRRRTAVLAGAVMAATLLLPAKAEAASVRTLPERAAVAVAGREEHDK